MIFPQMGSFQFKDLIRSPNSPSAIVVQASEKLGGIYILKGSNKSWRSEWDYVILDH